MAFSSLTPKRHWFLVVQRQRHGFYVFDQLSRRAVSTELRDLKSAKRELLRLKHLPMYREVAVPTIPASIAR